MQDPSKPNPEGNFPYLEYYAEGGKARLRIVINRSPFLIGRSKRANCVIKASEVSKHHAEIVCSGGQVRIRDLGSTNGTFVNGQRISEGLLGNGDILYIAHREFRFVHASQGSQSGAEFSKTTPTDSDLLASVIRGSERLRELLQRQAVLVLFQPIVDLQTREALGYEALCRSTHLDLNAGPSELFRLAEQCQLAAELSDLLRRVPVQEAHCLPAHARIFLNLHPTETLDEHLVDGLRELRKALRDDQEMVLEVHEDMVTDLRTMQWLRACLQRSGIELAHDDFGAGQARLAELAGAPPKFIKLDMSLVRGIDQATARQELIQALIRALAVLGIEAIAEGIETPAEAKVCHDLGCRFGQGYLLGRPQPASFLAAGFSPDHRLVATANWDDIPNVWDAKCDAFVSW